MAGAIVIFVAASAAAQDTTGVRAIQGGVVD